MSRPLRIAIVAPLVAPIREPFLGGAQALVFDLVAQLAARGQQVTCFAADGSRIPGSETPLLGIDAARLRPATFTAGAPGDPADAERQRAAFLRVAYEIRRRSEEFDLVHSHAFDAPAFELLGDAHPRVLHTLHLPPLLPGVVSAAREAAAVGATMITVSAAAARSWAGHGVGARVIHNGVPVDRIPFGVDSRRAWLFAGRIAPEKGLEDALAAADRSGRRLRIAGGVYDVAYHARMAPRLAGHDVLGQVPRSTLFAEMARASALLFPVQWDEPFGLAAVEAMAAGCPVASYRRGALPEIVREGVTGFMVPPGDVDLLAGAAIECEELDRTACRTWVEERFDLARMLAAHLSLYRTIST